MQKSAAKEPLEIPWDRMLPYVPLLVCEITNPPDMDKYFAVVMAVGQEVRMMFPMSKS